VTVFGTGSPPSHIEALRTEAGPSPTAAGFLYTYAPIIHPADPQPCDPAHVLVDPCLERGDRVKADFDDDGELTAFDALAFLNALMASDPMADCDRDGAIDATDWSCFQALLEAAGR
jgi:hypothetical protein